MALPAALAAAHELSFTVRHASVGWYGGGCSASDQAGGVSVSAGMLLLLALSALLMWRVRAGAGP